MKSQYKFITALLISVLLLSCNEEITLETKFEPQLFIFGNLTNVTENLKITIQESVSVENTSEKPKPVHNAKITLFTKNTSGDVVVLTDEFIENDGNYSSAQVLSPIIGNLYWIEIKLEDGTIYKSTEEQLKIPIAIDEISKVKGFLRANFKDPVDDRNFYKLEISAKDNNIEMTTYQLSSDILFNGNDNAFIEEGAGLTGNIIHATLMNFSYATYQFYLNIIIQEEAQEGGEEEAAGPSQLFASPPVHLTGNIMNTKTKKKALGNFGVMSISVYNTEIID